MERLKSDDLIEALKKSVEGMNVLIKINGEYKSLQKDVVIRYSTNDIILYSLE